MLAVILYQPEIPPNTGNVIRLCANTGAALHLIKPLGFALDAPRLRRAGLDYHEFAQLTVHEDLPACLAALGSARVFAFSARANDCYSSVAYRPGDALLFGPETRGLPGDVIKDPHIHQALRLPMRAGQRSLNLSNAVAVAVYEAWRQLAFAGA
ncbi:MAG: tRNA (cytidine(34)-2'-O)-methyltransferase [Gammaproteobacteria bacterium]|nr:tRNA (cytidine(34)-2'-O)-methyltransferase [Gammaproteobacteria bacterium]